jgi:hypothetical protein
LFQDFAVKLHDHLLYRLRGLQFNGGEHIFSHDDRNEVRIHNGQIYTGKVLRVNYTTYDVRRDQDMMNPSTDKADVMVLSQDDSHPYWYARILQIMYADVSHVGNDVPNRSRQRMEFLWVRWFGIEPSHRWGFKAAQLPRVGFVPDTDPFAFGFLDPSLVIRGCHLIPAFRYGRTPELLKTPGSAGRSSDSKDNCDYTAFYVGLCAISICDCCGN